VLLMIVATIACRLLLVMVDGVLRSFIAKLERILRITCKPHANRTPP
jgi:hypothetical protein